MKYLDFKEAKKKIEDSPNKPIIIFLIILVIASFFIANLRPRNTKVEKDNGISSDGVLSTESTEKIGAEYRMDKSLMPQNPLRVKKK